MMDKLIKYLKEELKLSDSLIIVVLDSIKVKYVVPTYYYDDLLFTDLNIFDEDNSFCNIEDFNSYDFNFMISSIIKDKAVNTLSSIASPKFKDLKEGEEYWAVYNDKPPINVVVKSITNAVKHDYSGTYNHIQFLNKVDNKISFSIHNAGGYNNGLDLFLTREEAVTFYKDKFDLN